MLTKAWKIITLFGVDHNSVAEGTTRVNGEYLMQACGSRTKIDTMCIPNPITLATPVQMPLGGRNIDESSGRSCEIAVDTLSRPHYNDACLRAIQAADPRPTSSGHV